MRTVSNFRRTPRLRNTTPLRPDETTPGVPGLVRSQSVPKFQTLTIEPPSKFRSSVNNLGKDIIVSRPGRGGSVENLLDLEANKQTRHVRPTDNLRTGSTRNTRNICVRKVCPCCKHWCCCLLKINRVIKFVTLLLTCTTLGLLIKQQLCWTYENELDLFGSLFRGSNPNNAVPLVHAHSQDDYLQSEPLSLALAAGFCSMEAAVHLTIDGELALGNETPLPTTLSQVYLKPLGSMAIERQGQPLYALAQNLDMCKQIMLIVNLKTALKPTWDALENQIKEENEIAEFNIFECYSGGRKSRGMYDGNALKNSPVRVVVTGIPSEEIDEFKTHVLNARDGHFCSTVDTHFDNLPTQTEVLHEHTMSMVSEEWDEHTNVQDRVDAAHARGLQVRFWNTPDDVNLWTRLLNHGVDFIGTDHLASLRAFLLHDL